MTSVEDLKLRLSSLTAIQRALLARRLVRGPSQKDETGEPEFIVAASISKASPLRVEVTPEGMRIEIYPASNDQERMWFLHRYTADSPAYCTPFAFHLRGPLDVNLLEKAFLRVTERHDMLRTSFAMENDALVQRVAASISFRIEEMPATDVSENDRAAAAERWIAQAASVPFDLSITPLFRVAVASIACDDHLLLIITHHIISDGWSLSNLFHEVSKMYNALATGTVISDGTLLRQFADYSAWQSQRRQSNGLGREISYWKEKLGAEPEPLDLPTDRPRPANKSFGGEECVLPLDPEVIRLLNQLARERNATLFMVLLAVFKVLLFRYTGQTNLIVGVPFANRPHAEIEELIGFFANTLVMRTEVSGDATFEDVLDRVRETALGAYDHQSMPFDSIVRILQVRRDPSRTPLFQASFALDDFPKIDLQLAGLQVTPRPASTHTSKFDLSLAVRPTLGGFTAALEYNSDIFMPKRAERMLQHWFELLKDAAAHPDKKISELNLLPEKERHLIVTEWNRTKRDYPRDRCIHQLFEDEVKRKPEAIALVFGDNCLSYQELNDKADALASHLKAMGVGPNVLVGLRIERSPEMVIALLGILKAGGTYWPLEDKLPEERLRVMLSDAQARVILVQRGSALLSSDFQQQVIAVEDLLESAREESIAGASEVLATDAAYVNYTSGSTGQPKAVAVSHRGVVRLVKGTDYATFSADETFLHLAPLSFDASTFELWGALLNGGRVVLATPGPQTLADIGETIRTHGVTTAWLTAGLFHLMVDERIEDLKPLRQLLTGGDALSPEHVRKAYEFLPECRLIDGYGPTENTTFTSSYTVTDVDAIEFTVPIGRPIANTQIYILDELLLPVPIGLPGELYAGGDGLARGYLHQPQLTDERFIPSPFDSEPGARLYRTGDRARWREDGNIEYLGRFDSQVKIRGFRVELGEIESILRAQPEVRDVAVIARELSAGNKELVAYLVAMEGEGPDTDTMRARLLKSLPEYMVPRSFVWLEEIPLNDNGKVNRKALPAPAAAISRSEGESTEATSLLELELIRIWQRLFQLENIGRQDNFFALGGHSLLATRLVAEIDRLLQCKLPIAALFQSPTVELLARRLRNDAWAPAWNSLVPLQPKGTKPILFLLHGLAGDVYTFLDLARRLGPDQPTYGIQGIGSDDSQPRPVTVEEAAAHYVKEIIAFQPEGAFYLGGYSMGGLFAFEVARQLRALGREVALLALFDTMPIGPTSWFFYWLAMVGHLPRLAMIHLGRLRQLPLRERFPYFRERLPAIRYWVSPKDRPLVVPTKPSAVGDPAVDSWQTDFYRILSLSYRPQPFPGSIDMFVAEDSISGWQWYWRYLARGGLTRHPISGRHHVLLAKEHLPSLAKILTKVLESKQAIFSPRGRTDIHA